MSSSPESKDGVMPLRRSMRKSVSAKTEELVLTPRKRKSTATPLKNIAEKAETVGTPKKTKAAATPKKTDSVSTPRKSTLLSKTEEVSKKNNLVENKRTPRKSLRSAKDDSKKNNDVEEPENNDEQKSTDVNEKNSSTVRGKRKSIAIIPKKMVEANNSEHHAKPTDDQTLELEQEQNTLKVSPKKKSRKSVHFKAEVDERHVDFQEDSSPSPVKIDILPNNCGPILEEDKSPIDSSHAMVPRVELVNCNKPYIKEASTAEIAPESDSTKIADIPYESKSKLPIEDSSDNALLSPNDFLNFDDDASNDSTCKEVETNLDLDSSFKSPRRKLSYDLNEGIHTVPSESRCEETQTASVKAEEQPKVESIQISNLLSPTNGKKHVKVDLTKISKNTMEFSNGVNTVVAVVSETTKITCPEDVSASDDIHTDTQKIMKCGNSNVTSTEKEHNKPSKKIVETDSSTLEIAKDNIESSSVDNPESSVHTLEQDPSSELECNILPRHLAPTSDKVGNNIDNFTEVSNSNCISSKSYSLSESQEDRLDSKDQQNCDNDKHFNSTINKKLENRNIEGNEQSHKKERHNENRQPDSTNITDPECVISSCSPAKERENCISKEYNESLKDINNKRNCHLNPESENDLNNSSAMDKTQVIASYNTERSSESSTEFKLIKTEPRNDKNLGSLESEVDNDDAFNKSSAMDKSQVIVSHDTERSPEPSMKLEVIKIEPRDDRISGNHNSLEPEADTDNDLVENRMNNDRTDQSKLIINCDEKSPDSECSKRLEISETELCVESNSTNNGELILKLEADNDLEISMNVDRAEQSPDITSHSSEVLPNIEPKKQPEGNEMMKLYEKPIDSTDSGEHASLKLESDNGLEISMNMSRVEQSPDITSHSSEISPKLKTSKHTEASETELYEEPINDTNSGEHASLKSVANIGVNDSSDLKSMNMKESQVISCQSSRNSPKSQLSTHFENSHRELSEERLNDENSAGEEHVSLKSEAVNILKSNGNLGSEEQSQDIIINCDENSSDSELCEESSNSTNNEEHVSLKSEAVNDLKGNGNVDSEEQSQDIIINCDENSSDSESSKQLEVSEKELCEESSNSTNNEEHVSLKSEANNDLENSNMNMGREEQTLDITSHSDENSSELEPKKTVDSETMPIDGTNCGEHDSFKSGADIGVNGSRDLKSIEELHENSPKSQPSTHPEKSHAELCEEALVDINRVDDEEHSSLKSEAVNEFKGNRNMDSEEQSQDIKNHGISELKETCNQLENIQNDLSEDQITDDSNNGECENNLEKSMFSDSTAHCATECELETVRKIELCEKPINDTINKEYGFSKLDSNNSHSLKCHHKELSQVIAISGFTESATTRDNSEACKETLNNVKNKEIKSPISSQTHNDFRSDIDHKDLSNIITENHNRESSSESGNDNKLPEVSFNDKNNEELNSLKLVSNEELKNRPDVINSQVLPVSVSNGPESTSGKELAIPLNTEVNYDCKESKCINTVKEVFDGSISSIDDNSASCADSDFTNAHNEDSVKDSDASLPSNRLEKSNLAEATELSNVNDKNEEEQSDHVVKSMILYFNCLKDELSKEECVPSVSKSTLVSQTDCDISERKEKKVGKIKGKQQHKSSSTKSLPALEKEKKSTFLKKQCPIEEANKNKCNLSTEEKGLKKRLSETNDVSKTRIVKKQKVEQNIIHHQSTSKSRALKSREITDEPTEKEKLCTTKDKTEHKNILSKKLQKTLVKEKQNTTTTIKKSNLSSSEVCGTVSGKDSIAGSVKFIDNVAKVTKNECHVGAVEDLFNNVTDVLMNSFNDEDDENDSDYVPSTDELNSIQTVDLRDKINKIRKRTLNYKKKRELQKKKKLSSLPIVSTKCGEFSICNYQGKKSNLEEMLKSSISDSQNRFVVSNMVPKEAQLGELQNKRKLTSLPSVSTKSSEFSISNYQRERNLKEMPKRFPSTSQNTVYRATAILPCSLSETQIAKTFKGAGISNIVSMKKKGNTTVMLEFADSKSFEKALERYGSIRYDGEPIYILAEESAV